MENKNKKMINKKENNWKKVRIDNKEDFIKDIVSFSSDEDVVSELWEDMQRDKINNFKGVEKEDKIENKNNYRIFGIENHEITGIINTTKKTEEEIQQVVKTFGYDGFIYMSPKTALVLMQVAEEIN